MIAARPFVPRDWLPDVVSLDERDAGPAADPAEHRRVIARRQFEQNSGFRRVARRDPGRRDSCLLRVPPIIVCAIFIPWPSKSSRYGFWSGC